MSYKAIIFDFDYTLGDCTSGIEDCVCTALRIMNMKEVSSKMIRKSVGLTLQDTYRFLTGDEELEKGEEFKKLFMNRADEIMAERAVLLPFAKEVVESLKEDGKQIGIVTTKYRFRIFAIFQALGLPDFIEQVIGSDNVESAKPDPEGLLQMIADMKLEKKDVLYVGDSIVDAETARNAGVDFAAVTTGATTSEEFDSFHPVMVMEDLRPVLSLSRM